MATQQVNLNFDSINASAQVGDDVYYTVPQPGTNGGFDIGGLDNTYYLGLIYEISGNTVKVQFDDAIAPHQPLAHGALISFVKDKKANTVSLRGYYAEVNLVNNSKEKAELFSLGSEVSESSQ